MRLQSSETHHTTCTKGGSRGESMTASLFPHLPSFSLSAVQNFAEIVRKSNVAALAPADSVSAVLRCPMTGDPIHRQDLSEENSEEQRDLDALELSNEAAGNNQGELGGMGGEVRVMMRSMNGVRQTADVRAEASSLDLSLESSDAIKRKNERSLEGEGTGAGFLGSTRRSLASLTPVRRGRAEEHDPDSTRSER